MGYRVKVRTSGGRYLYSRSYSTKMKAERAKKRTRGAVRVVKS